MQMDVVLQFTQPDRDMLRDVSADVKQILEGMHDHNAHDDQRFADVNARLIHFGQRIGKVEVWQVRAGAIYTVVGAFLGLVLRFLLK